MRIAIVGASGTLGSPTARLLDARGHEVRRLSRTSETYPVDLRTGLGLADALEGAEVVINAANGPPTARAADVLVDGTKRLLEASGAHHVCVSIVGIESLPPGYYKVKLAQEAAVRDSGRPFTIVRSTPFHEMVGPVLERLARWHVSLRSRARLQPIAVADAAEALADVAEQEPRDATITVAGPQILTLTEMQQGGGVPLPVPMMGRLGRAFRNGDLTVEEPDVRGVVKFAEWRGA
jgi:uncharacterized protein YbjT (DUF2867 family)